VLLGEAFSPLREAGMTLILTGLAMVVIPARVLARTKKQFGARSALGQLPALRVLRGSNFVVFKAPARRAGACRGRAVRTKSIRNSLKWIFSLTIFPKSDKIRHALPIK
jgi:hypothetical protein